MTYNTMTGNQFAEMVSKQLAKGIEEAVYEKIQPIADKIARQAAKDIANSVKAYAHFHNDLSKFEPIILLQFNGENIGLELKKQKADIFPDGEFC